MRPPAGQGSYGVDAPYLLVVPALLVVFAVVQGVVTDSPWPIAGAAVVVLLSSLGLYASRRGKFVVWARLLDDLHLVGDEQVLDVGCGRGAILVLAARRLTTGRAVGVDLWRKSDQSGNDRSVTERNVVLEGVTDRVQLETADMIDLPFGDETFAVVISNLAVHNVKTASGRDKAIDEATRVLRPGGRFLIADVFSVRQYRQRLTDIGMDKVACRSLGWRMWFSGPWMRTRLITATKPRPKVAGE
ncbi:MAG: class I SAM-dependent methyltransferase [Acidimicrobiales bacterium]